MNIFHKWPEPFEPMKFGINYDSADDGFEIVIKIPLWVFWRENYLDWDTYNFKSGKTIRTFLIYIRRRSDSFIVQSLKRLPYSRWIFDCMFDLSHYGKQKTILRREKDYFVRAEDFDLANT